MDWHTTRTTFESRLNTIMAKKDNTSDKALHQLHTDITKALEQATTDKSMDALLKENGSLQLKINHLQKQKDENKNDVETALARDELLRSKDISPHALFLLNKPIREGSIPYLWTLSFLFAVISYFLLGSLLSLLFPAIVSNSPYILPWYVLLYNYFMEHYILFSILVLCIISIVFLTWIDIGKL
jgi:hypothetical protein